MQTENWIPLMDYSTKYQVSLSTLRRRIKNNQIKYQFRAGKYYLTDHPLDIQEVRFEPLVAMTKQVEPVVSPSASYEQSPNLTTQPSSEEVAFNHDYFNELKKAYRQVLQEKEEQIQLLREEISDLRTLVRVLESENQRLSANLVREF